MTEVNNEETMQKATRKKASPKTVTVIAQARFAIADPKSTRGSSRRDPNASTGTRMIEKGQETEIPVELARKFQDNGVVKIKI